MTSSWPQRTVGSALLLTGALVFFLFEAIAAAAVIPSYSYVNNFISALGVPAWSPLAAVMNSGFWVQGIFILLGAAIVAHGSETGHRRWFIALVALTATGYLLVGTVYGDSAAAQDGLFWLHGLGAVLAIVSGNAAIVAGSAVVAGFVGARWYRSVSIILACVGFSSFVVPFFVSAAAADPGLWQRMSVYPVPLWQILSAVLLLTRPRASHPVAAKQG